MWKQMTLDFLVHAFTIAQSVNIAATVCTIDEPRPQRLHLENGFLISQGRT